MSDWCEIMDELHKLARERQRQAREFSDFVSRELKAERSKAMEEFTEADRRLFGMKDEK